MTRVFIGSVAVWLGAACLVLAQPEEVTPPALPLAPPGPAAPAAPLPPAPARPTMLPSEYVQCFQAAVPPRVSTESADFACPADHLWFSADYLIWGFYKDHTPPLVTIGSIATRGVLPASDTRVVFGVHPVSPIDEGHSGGRVEIGGWLDEHKEWAMTADFFYVGPRREEADFGPTAGDRVLARPIASLSKGMEISELVTFPGLSQGTVRIDNRGRLWGADANCMKQICGDQYIAVSVLAGFCYADLKEDLDILETKQFDNPVSRLFPEQAHLAGHTQELADHFGTWNHFYGGQVGLNVAYAYGPVVAQLLAKVAVGGNREIINIAGGQVDTSPTGGTTSFPGGLLALPSNSGRFSRGELAAIPEFGVNGGCRLWNGLYLHAGYTFLYWNRVVRSGEQIDRVVDTTQIANFPGTTAVSASLNRPAVPFQQATFWAQGFNLGIEIAW